MKQRKNMSIRELRSQQEELCRQIRRYDNRAQIEYQKAAGARSKLLEIGRKLMLARKEWYKNGHALSGR